MKKGPVCPVLSKIQLDAVKLIASGCTARYAALVLKIKVSEINKWMAHDKLFKSSLMEQIIVSQSDKSPETAKAKPAKKAVRAANATKRSPG